MMLDNQLRSKLVGWFTTMDLDDPKRSASAVVELIDDGYLHDSANTVSPMLANSIYCDVLHLRNQLGHLVNDDLDTTIRRLERNTQWLNEIAQMKNVTDVTPVEA